MGNRNISSDLALKTMGETPDAAIAKTAMLDSQFCLSPMKDDGDCVNAAKSIAQSFQRRPSGTIE